MAKQLDVDRMLQDVDKGKGPSQMGKVPGFEKGYTSDQTPPPPPKLPSKAPKGFDMVVKGDIGKARQAEAAKVFPGIAGKAQRNPLVYRMPKSAIDSKYGPGDKVCG